MTIEVGPRVAAAPGQDFLPIVGIDHVHFYVGNAKQAAYFYSRAFGFRVTAYAGLETGVRDRASYLLEQGEIRFLLTGTLGPDSEIARHALEHGDGVHDVAFRVLDAGEAWRQAMRRGAESVQQPTPIEDEHGRVVVAAIKAYGDTVHSFVEREAYSGSFLPGYRPHEPLPDDGPPVGLQQIDHVVANVELGKMNDWARYYADVLGFIQLLHFRDDQISTEYTALMSKVMWDGKGRIKLPINEPAAGKRKSQIQEYLDYYRSAGVQHIALHTDDIVRTVDALRRRGIQFIRVPATYYQAVRGRVGAIAEDYGDLERLGILADRDDEGYLLQTFTRTLQDRPTMFFEIIERRGARGFGLGNFKELFLAIEREQAERGNL